MDLSDPVTAATLAADALAAAGIPHALYGGLLLAAYGEPRETRDADLAVVEADAGLVARALAAAGLETQLVFADLAFGGLSLDRFSLLGGATATGLNSLDIVRPRSARYRAAAVARSLTAPLRDREVRALAPEDFVLFKLLSTRARDLEDAVSVLRRTRAAIDQALVRGEVRSLALEIPDHDVGARFAELEAMVARP